jgi:hypothetical protein
MCVFSAFEEVLGPVGAAKCLHLLSPCFFPFWDRPIAAAHGLQLRQKGRNAERYLRFMEIVKEQVQSLDREQAIGRNPLKIITETSYQKILKKILKLLQQELALIDWCTEPRRQSSSGFEFLLWKLKNIKLKMYQEKHHKKPHLHIDYGEQNHIASFAIEPPSRIIIDGIKDSLPSKYNDSIINWITTNKETLLKIWNAAQAGSNPNILIAQLAGNA